MRNLLTSTLACVLATLIAAPAAAQNPPPAPDIAGSLPHPFEVEEAGDRIAAAVGAIG